MNENIKLRKALDTIALKHAEGIVSNDILIKACENYKEKVNFVEDFDYEIIVAKSIFDTINGIEQDEKIAKAIIPGQTKVIDGIMYVYTATPNAKTQYDWRVFKKGIRGTKAVGKSGKLTDKEVDLAEKWINELFPKDLSTLKVVKKLGGSTGAQLVEDARGNKYVMKKGGNTNNDHVKAEYLANQLYATLGQKTPDYELYEENGEQILLSRYIPLTTPPTLKNHGEMAKGFIADCLLANWDVYQNDNCLIDSAGRVIRVDNGGCLNFRAKGQTKTFNSDILKSFDDMAHYNSSVYGKLKTSDILKQIQEVKEKKDDIVNFLLESGEDKLANIIKERIDNLSKLETRLQKKLKKFKPNTTPRKLLPASQMYREFTEDELKAFWDNAKGNDAQHKILEKGSEGWALLAEICKARGFDARPRVVDEKTYWDYVSKLPKNLPMMFRGEQDKRTYNQVETEAEIFAYDFRHSDSCFFGTQAAHGQGIYAHCNDAPNLNDSTPTGYKKSYAYKHAMEYSERGRYDECINLLAFEPDAKLISQAELIKMIKAEKLDKVDTSKEEAELKQLEAKLKLKSDTINNFTDILRKQVYSKMNYNETAVADMLATIDDLTNWGAVDSDGNPDFPKFDKIVKGEFTKWVTDNGGQIKQAHGQITFSLPHSQNEITLHQYQFDMDKSIRRPQPMLPAYHIYAERFKEWFVREHVQKVEKAFQDAIDLSGETVEKLKEEMKQLSARYDKKVDEIEKIKNFDPNKSIMHGIYNEIMHNRAQALGIYAAIKGYDAIYKPNGNGRPNGFAIILNRSKLVVKEM